MGCPIHIWLPLMGAAAPFARVARDRFRAMRPARRLHTETADAPREMKRWAPVGQPPAEQAEPGS
jgi:hypothetical protein